MHFNLKKGGYVKNTLHKETSFPDYNRIFAIFIWRQFVLWDISELYLKTIQFHNTEHWYILL